MLFGELPSGNVDTGFVQYSLNRVEHRLAVACGLNIGLSLGVHYNIDNLAHFDRNRIF
ncbi:hypothetical protein [Mycolicibacterium sphagni]|uniref:hypothetical protein n=1 Tax=Mycolicibacterium sphagni TaxID=1786 RepID=UPI0021F2647C|nr:hypothetical protein [Mycolicibacterium sphagni]